MARAERGSRPEQVVAAFPFLMERGFRVVRQGTSTMGWQSCVLGLDRAGVHAESDMDSAGVGVSLIQLDQGRVIGDWRDARARGVGLGLGQVAKLLAPELLDRDVDLPRIRREADRAPHLRFWAGVLQAVAMPGIDGDRDWFTRTEARLRG